MIYVCESHGLGEERLGFKSRDAARENN